MVLCFQHFQWLRLDELLWFQYMENTKVTPVKINVALLLCFPHFHLVMRRYFCVFHISKYCIRGTFVFSIFSMLGIERTFVFSIYWKHKSWNRQKSKKVLLLRFVTFVTFVFYAHPYVVCAQHKMSLFAKNNRCRASKPLETFFCLAVNKNRCHESWKWGVINIDTVFKHTE